MRRKRIFVFLVTLVFAFLALSFVAALSVLRSKGRRDFQKIAVGMSSNEVISILGRPGNADSSGWDYFSLLGLESIRIYYTTNGTVDFVYHEPLSD